MRVVRHGNPRRMERCMPCGQTFRTRKPVQKEEPPFCADCEKGAFLQAMHSLKWELDRALETGDRREVFWAARRLARVALPQTKERLARAEMEAEMEEAEDMAYGNW